MSQEDDELERKKELWRATSPEARAQEWIEKLSRRVEVNEDEARRKNEETQRKIEFIVQQRAQFVEDMQRLKEAQQRLSESQGRTERIVESLAIASHNRFEEPEGRMAALIDSHIRLADTQAQTDERLSAFITTVERLISERRNGGPEV